MPPSKPVDHIDNTADVTKPLPESLGDSLFDAVAIDASGPAAIDVTGAQTLADASRDRGETISTRAATVAAPAAPPAEVPSLAPPALSSGLARYQLGELIGKGGMGEVMTATDTQIIREVAIKRMRFKPSPQGYARFVREARVQGRLDHPAIVPVHELSIDTDGRPFFAMKRLTGTTLHEILEQRREGDPFAHERYSRQRLLRTFADVCLAVEFAHTRSVIHRDLKPANIVVGDFGDVYVLDWGVARVLAGAGPGSAGEAGDVDSLGYDVRTLVYDEVPNPTPPVPAPGAIDDIPPTEAGTILGTPGYIPPEQIRGDPGLDHRADVYALGCILFEILCDEPLFPRGRPGLTAPFGDVDARPSERAGGRDVPPELDALCVGATRAEPADRIQTARALGERVQRYLDGDRDLALRRRVAVEHLAAARAALAAGDDEGARRTAMREAGRAMALDPTATDAADLASRMILEPPATTPAEVEAEIATAQDADVKTMTRVAIGAFAAYLSFLPVMAWIGVRSAWHLALLGAVIVGNGLLAFAVSRRSARVTSVWIYGAALANGLLIGIFARMLSPFLVAPGLAAGTMMAFSLYPAVRIAVLWIISSLGVLVPWLLEVTGVWSSTMRIVGGDLILHSPTLEVSSPAIEIALVAYVLCLIGITGLMASRLSATQRAVSRKLQLQAWHLRQLMSSR